MLSLPVSSPVSESSTHRLPIQLSPLRQSDVLSHSQPDFPSQVSKFVRHAEAAMPRSRPKLKVHSGDNERSRDMDAR